MAFWITRFIAGVFISASLVFVLIAYVEPNLLVTREATLSMTFAVLAVAALLFDRR